MALDPTLQPIEPWSGAWPPDPSWDALPPILPAPAESPVPDVAFAPLPAAPAPSEQPFPGPSPVPTEPTPAWATDLQFGLAPTGPEAPPPPAAQQPPPELGLDAISGGALPAPPQPPPPTDEEQLAALEQPGAVDVLRQMDPVAFALIEAKHQNAADNEAATKRLDEAEANRQTAETNARVRQEAIARTRTKMDAIAAERDRLANERVDPDGWRNSRNVFQTIAMYVAGIVGGLVQSRQGGPNQGLAMINDAIEKHIAAQRENMAHRRAMLDQREGTVREEAARAEQDFVTTEAFRQASLKRAMDQIETERQAYHPAGTRNLRLARLLRDIDGQLAAASQSAEAASLKHDTETVELELKREQLLAARMKNRGIGMGGGVGRQPQLEEMFSPEQFKEMGFEVVPPGPKTMREFKEWVSQRKSTADLNKAEADAKTAKNKVTIFDPQKRGDDTVIRNADGSPLEVDASLGTELKKKIGAADALARIVAQQKELISANGGVLNPRSKAAVVAKSNQGAIANSLRALYGMGALDESANKLADTIQGGDPTQFFGNAEAGLEAMLVQAETDIDSNLRAQGGWRPKEGEAYRLPRFNAPKAKPDQDYTNAISATQAPVADLADLEQTKKQIDIALGRALSPRQRAGVEALATGALTNPVKMDRLIAAASNADNDAAKSSARTAIRVLASLGNARATKALDNFDEAD